MLAEGLNIFLWAINDKEDLGNVVNEAHKRKNRYDLQNNLYEI